MSPVRSRRNQGATVAGVLLLVAGVYLGVRAWATVREVLSPDPGEAPVPAAAAIDDVARADAMDARLETVGEPERDPFHVPPRPVVHRRVTRPAEPEAPPPPVVRMILFDEVSPEVQIEVGGRLSGRLEVGSSFGGWTVVSISENTVVVSNDEETHTLRLRR